MAWLVAGATTLYVRRVDDGATNVDDYLYGRQTIAVWGAIRSLHGIRGTWREFAVNSPLVPTLAAPLVAVTQNPARLVLVNIPLLVGLLFCVAVLFRSLGLNGTSRWLWAGLLTAAAPVLMYTVMLNFSIAASLFVVASVAAYLRSERLRNLRVCVLLGALLGLLSLTRVVAVVYLAALAAPLLLDAALDRAERRSATRNCLVVIGVAALIAAPWWLTAGPDAVHYLLDAGYSGDSVFVGHADPLQRQLDRLSHTADETGWLLAAALLVVFVSGALLSAVRLLHTGGRDDTARSLVVVAGVVVIGMVGLGTSTNAGTAFALPYVVLAAAVGVAGWHLALPTGERMVFWTRAAAAIAIGGLISFTTTQVLIPQAPPTWRGHQLWLSGTPARAQLEQALGCSPGCRLPDAAELNARVVSVIRGAPTLILRDDALINPESLRFRGEVTGIRVDLTAQPTPGPVNPSSLTGVDFALAGSTLGPYQAIDLTGADTVLRTHGWCEALAVRLSPGNTVELWASPNARTNCAQQG